MVSAFAIVIMKAERIGTLNHLLMILCMRCIHSMDDTSAE